MSAVFDDHPMHFNEALVKVVKVEVGSPSEVGEGLGWLEGEDGSGSTGAEGSPEEEEYDPLCPQRDVTAGEPGQTSSDRLTMSMTKMVLQVRR